MSKFKQLETGTVPADIQITIPLEQAEQFKKFLEVCEGVSYDNVVQAIDLGPNESGEVTFICPGYEAGENGELIPELGDYLDNLNEEIIREAEEAEL